MTSKITLDARYVYSRSETDNSGIGGFNLPSTGATTHGTNQQFFLTETQVVNTSTINESRFQYFRNDSNSLGNDPELNISVANAFTQGSNYQQTYSNAGNYEFQNYTSITHGTQFIKFGARLRDVRQCNYTTANFLGQFNFANINDYAQFEQGLSLGVPLTTLFAAGVGPIQYQQNARCSR